MSSLQNKKKWILIIVSILVMTAWLLPWKSIYSRAVMSLHPSPEHIVIYYANHHEKNPGLRDVFDRRAFALNKKDVPALLTLLSDDDGKVRYAASRALHHMQIKELSGTPAISALLQQYLAEKKERPVMWECMQALFPVNEEIVELIRNELTAMPDRQRQRVPMLLGSALQPEIGLELLLELLDDISPQVRHQAVFALAEKLARDTISNSRIQTIREHLLETSEHDLDKGVRQSAGRLIELLDARPEGLPGGDVSLLRPFPPE